VNKIFLVIALVGSIIVLLNGCAQSIYRVQESDVGKVFVLKQPYFLLEDKHAILPFHKFSLCDSRCPTILKNFPKSIAEYQANSGYWQQWGGGMGFYERIVTIIPKGTHYRILSRHPSGFNIDGYETVRLLDGPVPNVTADFPPLF
jgi:hypothetical protein